MEGFAYPKDGFQSGVYRTALNICSGFTDEQWYAKSAAERKRFVEELNPSHADPEPEMNINDGPTMYCSHCGEKILKEAVICPHCGCATGNTNETDEPSGGLNCLSFLFPIVGLILYCVFQSSTPKKAAAIGKWALIGFCVGLLFSVLLAIL
jgi:uncharacterized protein (DUF983 family)